MWALKYILALSLCHVKCRLLTPPDIQTTTPPTPTNLNLRIQSPFSKVYYIQIYKNILAHMIMESTRVYSKYTISYF